MKSPSRIACSWSIMDVDICGITNDYRRVSAHTSQYAITDCYSEWPELFTAVPTAESTTRAQRKLFGKKGAPPISAKNSGTHFTVELLAT